MKNAKMNYYNAFFKDNHRKIKSTWKGISRLIGNESKFSNKDNSAGHWGYSTVGTDPIEMSNILNTYFSEIGPSIPYPLKFKIHPVILLIILPRRTNL